MEVSNEYTEEYIFDTQVTRQIALEMALQFNKRNHGYVSPEETVETAEIFERFLKG